MRVSNSVIHALSQLSKDLRTRTDAIVGQHVQACRRNGVLVENYDRLVTEAIEMAKWEAAHPEHVEQAAAVYEPHRSYRVYESPRVP